MSRLRGCVWCLCAYALQVDGLLLLHLMNEDWSHLGINSPITVRRIDVAMQEYRLRFERKQVIAEDVWSPWRNMSLRKKRTQSGLSFV